MVSLRLANDITMFLVELAMLTLFGFGGFRIVSEPIALQWVLAIGLPTAAIALWSARIAPRATRRFSQPTLAMVKMFLVIAAAFVGTFASASYASIFIFIATLTVIGEFALGSNAATYHRS